MAISDPLSFTRNIFAVILHDKNNAEREYIEDVYFFDVNAKYISSSVLKTSEFHECAARVKFRYFQLT